MSKEITWKLESNPPKSRKQSVNEGTACSGYRSFCNSCFLLYWMNVYYLSKRNIYFLLFNLSFFPLHWWRTVWYIKHVSYCAGIRAWSLGHYGISVGRIFVGDHKESKKKKEGSSRLPSRVIQKYSFYYVVGTASTSSSIKMVGQRLPTTRYSI